MFEGIYLKKAISAKSERKLMRKRSMAVVLPPVSGLFVSDIKYYPCCAQY